MSDTPQHRVLIALPVTKNCTADIRTIQWADRLAWQPGATDLDVEFLWSASDACQRGRNTIIEVAYGMEDWPFTHICTLDTDLVPQKGMLDTLIAHDKDVVGGCYPCRIAGIHMWSFKLWGEGEWWHGGDPRIELADMLGYPLLRVECLAGGVVLSRRKVFDAIGWPWHNTIYQPMDDQKRSVEISEDVWFCKRAIEQGFELYVDVSCTTDHFNTVALP